VDFRDALSKAMGDSASEVRLAGTNPVHFSSTAESGEIKMMERPVSDPGFDANTVDIEDEMGRLSGNYMAYNLSARMLRKKFSILMTAIKEGR
jgi:flagellar basal-body rod protein FlgB